MWNLYLDDELVRANISAHYAFEITSTWCAERLPITSRCVFLPGTCVLIVNEQPRWRLSKV